MDSQIKACQQHSFQLVFRAQRKPGIEVQHYGRPQDPAGADCPHILLDSIAAIPGAAVMLSRKMAAPCCEWRHHPICAPPLSVIIAILYNPWEKEQARSPPPPLLPKAITPQLQVIQQCRAHLS